MNERGLFYRWRVLPGNARETWGREGVEGLDGAGEKLDRDAV